MFWCKVWSNILIWEISPHLSFLGDGLCLCNYGSTSWSLSRARMWSRVSMLGLNPPCRQKIWPGSQGCIDSIYFQWTFLFSFCNFILFRFLFDTLLWILLIKFTSKYEVFFERFPLSLEQNPGKIAMDPRIYINTYYRLELWGGGSRRGLWSTSRRLRFRTCAGIHRRTRTPKMYKIWLFFNKSFSPQPELGSRKLMI